MPALMREILLAFGKNKQDDLATKSLAAALWRLNKINAALATVKLNTENDAAEYGKGHEFATEVFKTSWDVSGQFEKYLSSEIAAWAFAFGLGRVVLSGEPGKAIYTCSPLDLAADGLELPPFTVVEQMRPGANKVIDRALIGCAVEGFQVAIASGPGRANSKITIDWVGTGKYTEPSGIAMPAKSVEHLLPSASAAVSINGTDYVANKNLVSVEFGWKNNHRLDAGFYPGSGFQDPADAASGAIRGRMEVGDREANLRFVARFDKDSDQLAKLKSQVTGQAVVSVEASADDSLQVTFQKISYSAVELAETDGLVTVQVDCQPQYDANNGLITAVAKCTTDGICQAA